MMIAVPCIELGAYEKNSLAKSVRVDEWIVDSTFISTNRSWCFLFKIVHKKLVD